MFLAMYLNKTHFLNQKRKFELNPSWYVKYIFNDSFLLFKQTLYAKF